MDITIPGTFNSPSPKLTKLNSAAISERKKLAKVSLQPGESRTVTIPLDARAFAFYDPAKEQWRAEAGAFQILVGDSSDNIALRGEWTLARDVSAASLGK